MSLSPSWVTDEEKLATEQNPILRRIP